MYAIILAAVLGTVAVTVLLALAARVLLRPVGRKPERYQLTFEMTIEGRGTSGTLKRPELSFRPTASWVEQGAETFDLVDVVCDGVEHLVKPLDAACLPSTFAEGLPPLCAGAPVIVMATNRGREPATFRLCIEGTTT